MKKLIQAYEELINPIYIRSLIKTEERFYEWCEMGTIEDLKNTLKVFEEAEMYEDCAIIKKALDNKTALLI